MKKQFLFIVLILILNVSFAQLVDGTPFDFCKLNGIQYNPGYHPEEDNPRYSNMWVTVREDNLPVLPNLQFGSREASICNAG